MVFWHMQIKYYDIVKNEKTFLKIRDDGDNKEIIEIFNNEVKINDIILIKNRQRPIYLVKIIGVMKNNQIEIEIFNRNTKILNDYPLGTVDTEIKKVSNKSLPAYQYIDKLYKGNIKDLISDIKIKELYIDDYKMFKDFTIKFTDKNDTPLPIIVIAGINGTGKTTLMEYIYKNNFLRIGAFYQNNTNYIKLTQNNKIKILNNEAKKKKKDIDDYMKRESERNGIAFYSGDDNGLFLDDLNKHILYIKALDDNITDLKKAIVSYYKKESRRLDSYSKALEQIKEFIAKIFIDLDILFILSDIDDIETDNEKVTFKNKNGKEFDINQLSTGEKTLLSKVLYLYFKDVKNQIILIDEPELSLHPAWQNKVLKLYENFAKENNCQIIIATHSPHIIGSAKPEWIRLLTENGVVDNFSKSYGLEFSRILTDIMGVKDLRTPEVNKKFTFIENMIAENKFDTDEFKEKWQELENILGKDYFDLKLLKLEIASRRKDVQDNKE